MKAPRTILCLIAVAASAAYASAQGNVDHATMWLANQDQQPMDGAVREAPAREIRVQVWHGRDDDAVYQRGDELEIFFRANQDLYVVVYRLDAEGLVEVLWPTSRYDDGFAYGGHNYLLPPSNSTRRLRTSQIKGVEYVEAIASEYPFDLRDLAIDFRFADEQGEPFDYVVEGDPFLAINDINYAITGLEEDAPYIVTDFTHLYVDERVEYARYSCRQCHVEDEHHHPYVHSCTEVVIRYDYGWYDRWYLRYGWYPVYYDPFYTVWNVHWGRPYYYWYYPIYYSWPGYYYDVYTRPYPVYSYDPPVRYKPVRPPLYERPDARDRLDRFGRRDIVRSDDNRGDERLRIVENRPSRIVDRDRPVADERRDRDVGGRIDRPNTGPQVRPSSRIERGDEDRRIRAQPSPRTIERRERLRDEGSSGRAELRSGDAPRRWTRPILRNAPRSQDDSGRRVRDEVREDDRSRSRDDQRPAPRQRVQPDRSNRKDERPREIRRPDPPKEKARANPPRDREVKRDDRRGSDNKPAPKPAPRSAPPKSRGGGKSSKSRGGGSGSNGGG